MIVDPVTARYTDALFALATEQGAVAEVLADVERIGAEVADEQVSTWLFDARVAIEEKRSKVEVLASGFHSLTRNFIGLLFDKGREQVLGGLAEAYRERWLTSQGSVEGYVEPWTRERSPSWRSRSARRSAGKSSWRTASTPTWSGACASSWPAG